MGVESDGLEAGSAPAVPALWHSRSRVDPSFFDVARVQASAPVLRFLAWLGESETPLDPSAVVVAHPLLRNSPWVSLSWRSAIRVALAAAPRRNFAARREKK